MRPALYVAIVVVVGFGAVRPASSQSLGDVAKREEERRKDVKAPAKVYSNKDLGSAPAPPPASDAKPAAAATPDAAKGPADKAAGDGADKGDKAKEPAKDQAYWAKRRKELADKIARDRVLVEAVQSRINALTADFAARADPVQRAGIERDRQQALGELTRLQQEIKDTQKALSEFDEEARKAGVPAGWLR